MKKSWKQILAIAAVLVLALCVLSGCSDNSKAKIDEAVKAATDAAAKEKDEALAAAKTAADEALKAAQDAADTAKGELEGKVKELTDQLTAAVDAAAKEKDEAVAAANAAAEEAVKAATEAAAKEKDEALAAAQTAADEALKAAQDAADTAKAELEGQVKSLNDQLAAAAEEAKTAAEAALKEKDEAVAAAESAAEAAKTELQAKVDELTAQLADAEKAAMEGADAAIKNAQEAADAAKAELEGQVKELTDKLAAAEEAAKKAAEDAIKEKEEAVKAAVEAAAAEKDEAVKAATEAAEKAKEEAVEAAKAEAAAALKEAEDKVADLEAQLQAAISGETAAEDSKETEATEETGEAVPAEGDEKESKTEAAPEEIVMSHEDYINAELDSQVRVDTYVQATQSWWDNKITVYAQSPDGAYFIYNMACSEEDAAKLVPGTAIRVTGYKSEWSGEVEITDAQFELLEGEAFLAEAEDVTDKLGTEELINCQNELVIFKGMTVEPYDDTGAAFAYKNAENKTDDLYFKVSKDGQIYDFCVEYYLCNEETEIYKAITEKMQVGDVLDIEAYLYWYNGANPHTIKVTKVN